jgi:hypothetical protein
MATPTLPAHDREWLRVPEVIAEFPFTEDYLAQLRHRGAGPRFFRRGRVVLYRRAEVLTWLESHMTEGGPARTP